MVKSLKLFLISRVSEYTVTNPKNHPTACNDDPGEVFAAKHIVCKRASERKRVREEIDILREVRHDKLIRLHSAYQDNDKIVQVLDNGYNVQKNTEIPRPPIQSHSVRETSSIDNNLS